MVRLTNELTTQLIGTLTFLLHHYPCEHLRQNELLRTGGAEEQDQQ